MNSAAPGPPPGAALDAGHPWLGLRSYAEENEPWFRGRDHESAELLALVQIEPLSVLFGVSGLGKTSLLCAGLFPKLRCRSALPVPIRLDLAGAAPLAAQVLAAFADAASVHASDAPVAQENDSLWEFFHRRTLDADSFELWSPENQRLTPVLVFDQFEEIFTLATDAGTRARVRDFIVELAALVQNVPPPGVRERIERDPAHLAAFSFEPAPVRVLLSLREDFVADLEGLRPHLRAVATCRLRLRPLNGTRALEVIEKNGKDLVDPSVAVEIVRFVAASQRGPAESENASVELRDLAIEPALLSIMLHELNLRRLAANEARLTAELLRNAGPDILEEFCTRSFTGLPDAARTFVEEKLITPSGWRDSCAVENALLQPAITREIINTLVDRRLLRIDHRAGGMERVELAHDVLCHSVRQSRDARSAQEAIARAEREAAERVEAERRKGTKILANAFDLQQRESPEPEAAPYRSWRPNISGTDFVRVVAAVMMALTLWFLSRALAKSGPSGEGIGSFLARTSYDINVALFGLSEASEEGRIVSIDQGSPGATSDYRDVARFVRRCTSEGARCIVFDFLLSPASNPGADEELAAALTENGKVFLGAAFKLNGNGSQEVIAPSERLRRAASGWGLARLKPDADFAVRQYDPGSEEVPALTWRAAIALGAPIIDSADVRMIPRWLNYRAFTKPSPEIPLAQAISGTPSGFFKDKIVIVVGKAHAEAGFHNGRDTFRIPSSFGRGDVHLTGLLNLVHGDWLTRLNPSVETGISVVFGFLLALVLPLLRPIVAITVTSGAILALACGTLVALNTGIWFSWMVPLAVLAPLALLWAINSNNVLERRRNLAIRQAFACYLSPHMAREIAEERFDLRPGGRIVEATMMFTDLKGFTSLSEYIHDPQRVSELLVAYFNHTSHHILNNMGTIIEYVGDSVYATWGAPLPDPDHPYHAVLAAWGMHQFSRLNVQGHDLVTRIGLNTGTALAGNLGSDFRFDYTLIGDAVNLASRLESLNRYLGTQILLTESTWARVSDRFVARLLGNFVLMGNREPIAVYELLGPSVTNAIQSMVDIFSEGLDAFRSGDLAKTRVCMERTMARWDGSDGPSEFYLKEVARLEKSGLPADWSGVVEIGR